MPITVRTLGVPFRLKVLRAPCPIVVHSCRAPTVEQATTKAMYMMLKTQTAAGADPQCDAPRLEVNESVLVPAPYNAEIRIEPCAAAQRRECAAAAEDVLVALADHHRESGATW